MLVSDFDFILPCESIAQDASPRAASRLLLMERATGGLVHATVSDLPRFLREGDLLVVNNTRVFAARLLGRRVPTGGAVECLLLARDTSPEHAGDAGSEIWTALMHPGQKLKPGSVVRFEADAGVLMGEVTGRHFQGRRTIRLWPIVPHRDARRRVGPCRCRRPSSARIRRPIASAIKRCSRACADPLPRHSGTPFHGAARRPSRSRHRDRRDHAPWDTAFSR